MGAMAPHPPLDPPLDGIALRRDEKAFSFLILSLCKSFPNTSWSKSKGHFPLTSPDHVNPAYQGWGTSWLREPRTSHILKCISMRAIWHHTSCNSGKPFCSYSLLCNSLKKSVKICLLAREPDEVLKRATSLESQISLESHRFPTAAVYSGDWVPWTVFSIRGIIELKTNYHTLQLTRQCNSSIVDHEQVDSAPLSAWCCQCQHDLYHLTEGSISMIYWGRGGE